MRIIAIGGEPATGKSTLVRAILADLEPSHAFQFGRLRGHHVRKENLFVLGVYNPGETFPGTDRLSMSVHPDAVAFLRHVKTQPSPGIGEPPPAQPPTILFEGDRLVGAKFLRECAAHGFLHFYVLTASRKTKDLRHELRKDTQGDAFLAGRVTKSKNLVEAFQPNVWPMEDLQAMTCLKNLLIAKIKEIRS